MKVIHLKPSSPFKDPFPHSDTLFGALSWGIRHVFGEEALTDLLADFKNGRPPFKISSLFPYHEQTYYLPIPKTPTFIEENPENFEEMWQVKEDKKLRWITAEGLDQFIQGKKDLETVLKETDRKTFVTEFEQPGNAINRLSSATEGNLFFEPVHKHLKGTELYFLLKTGTEDVEGKIKGALRYLETRGIGGSTSTGKGSFELGKIGKFEEFEEDEEADSFMTLSLYSPTGDEWSRYRNNENKLHYELVKRKGVVEQSFTNLEAPWKRTLFMFSEGSIFPAVNGNDEYGRNPIVNTEEFDVQQYGYAFPIGVKI